MWYEKNMCIASLAPFHEKYIHTGCINFIQDTYMYIIT